MEEVGGLLLEELKFAGAKVKDKAAFGHEDGVGRRGLLPKGACAADIAFGEFGHPDLHRPALGGKDQSFAVGGDEEAGRGGALLEDGSVGFDRLEQKGL